MMINEILYALADMVLQFGYRTKFKGKDAIYDGGMSSIESAISVLRHHGLNTKRDNIVIVDNLISFMRTVEEDD